MIKILIKRLSNRKIIDLGWWLWYMPKDIINKILGNKDPYIPPIRKMFDGSRSISSFKTDGDKLFQYYIELCDLKSNERILDIGCGIGRKTRPLIGYLKDDGHYDGIDIVKNGIKWCKDAITNNNPNFQFQYVDVYNKHYNPNGNIKASEFTFPFDNDSFDFVVLYSVFTHMLPEDVENYLGEVSRVLRENGRCLISYFLLNSESKENIVMEKTNLSFKYRYGNHLTINPSMPEDAICYDETYILDLYDKHRLTIKSPISYGSWSARKEYVYYQDIIIAYL